MLITIRVLDHTGDTSFQYDSELALEEAATKFRELKGNGFTLFSVDPDTKETTLVEELFPAPQFIAIPQISGG